MTSDTRPANDLTIVLYIGGESRSGSTVLSGILGSYDGVVSVGECRTVWKALSRNELCGCGEPVRSCEFWIEVGKHAYGGWASVDVESMIKADWRLARHRAIPGHALRRWRPIDPDFDRYRANLARLYEAIRIVSGSGILVDSTKDPSYAYLLGNVPGIDLRIVHLVRDSRGVAYSNAKARIVRPELADEIEDDGYMPAWPLWRTAVTWMAKNLALSGLSNASRRRLVRYEALVANPGEQLGVIREFAGIEGSGGSWEEATGSFESLPHHTLGGNPVRFRHGRMRLEADEEWKSKMSGRQQFVVSALTFPLLITYGYPLIVRGRIRN